MFSSWQVCVIVVPV